LTQVNKQQRCYQYLSQEKDNARGPPLEIFELI